MATFAGGKIEAYAGSRDLNAPDDLERAIVDFIAGARSSLDVAVQELDSEPIGQAILDASWLGVDVKLVLEQDYLREAKLPQKPRPRAGETDQEALRRWQWSPGSGGLSENRRIASALLQSSVDLKADFNKDIFHQKFVLRDYRGNESRRLQRPLSVGGEIEPATPRFSGTRQLGCVSPKSPANRRWSH